MDVPAHQAVQELLPWYATSQLAPEEAQRVHAHLQTCMQCRRDLEWEHGMRSEAQRGGDELPADSSGFGDGQMRLPHVLQHFQQRYAVETGRWQCE